jgi:hypothetical protein
MCKGERENFFGAARRIPVFVNNISLDAAVETEEGEWGLDSY